MKKIFILNAFLFLLFFKLNAQTKKDRLHQYRNFPIIATIQFHSLGPPFHKMEQNFSNIGFTIGTEISLNGTHRWIQQLHAGEYTNHNAGNGWMIYTQTAYRPYLIGKLMGEVKVGVGWMMAMHPVDAYKFENGNWVNKGIKGKSMLMIPLSISLSYDDYKIGTYFSPFITYQVFINGVYNQSFPIMLNSIIQVGIRIHLKNKKDIK